MMNFFFSVVFFAVLGFELRAYTLSHSTSPFLWWDYFKIGCPELFAQDWLWTSILLISASWVARHIGVSHRLPVRDELSKAQQKMDEYPMLLFLLLKPLFFFTNPVKIIKKVDKRTFPTACRI
jgi:hypothetical protein